MKPDYKNWIPKGMLFSLVAGTALSFALLLIFGVFGIGVSGKLRIALGVVFGICLLYTSRSKHWCKKWRTLSPAACWCLTLRIGRR